MPPLPRSLGVSLFAAAALAASLSAFADELRVGEDEEFWTPSEAANYAKAGDTIVIREGRYEDCAVWRANDLVIRAEGEGAEIHGQVCQKKALWVTRGHGITIENITFTGAKAPDGNGAGIRAEGRDLTVRNSRFVDNQGAILGIERPRSEVIIEGSTFLRNGQCERGCAHAIYFNEIALLRIVDSEFRETRVTHNIKSQARRTEVIDSIIVDGDNGSSSYAVDLSFGGDAEIRGNRIHKGKNSDNQKAAVAVAAQGARYNTHRILLADNSFESDAPGSAALVYNFDPDRIDKETIILRNNKISGNAKALEGPGTVEGACMWSWLPVFGSKLCE